MRSHLAGRLSTSMALLVASAPPPWSDDAASRARCDLRRVTIGTGGYGGYANGNIVAVTAVNIPGTLNVADVKVAPATDGRVLHRWHRQGRGRQELLRPGRQPRRVADQRRHPAQQPDRRGQAVRAAGQPDGRHQDADQRPRRPAAQRHRRRRRPPKPVGSAPQCVPVGTDIAKSTSDGRHGQRAARSPRSPSASSTRAGGPVTSNSARRARRRRRHRQQGCRVRPRPTRSPAWCCSRARPTS